MQKESQIELRRNRAGHCWEAYHLGPLGKHVTEMFGVPSIPTSWTDEADGAKVKAAIQKLNPGVLVTLEDERLNEMEAISNRRLGL